MRRLLALLALLAAMTATLPAAQGSSPPSRPTLRSTAIYRGRCLTYEVVDGLAVFEGDIILGKVADLTSGRLSARPLKSATGQRMASVYGGDLWPGGLVPYVIDPDLPNPERFVDGAKLWSDVTLVRFVPRKDEPNYVRVTRGFSGTSHSQFGMVGGEQTIDLVDFQGTGTAAHEIGHTLGLLHEFTRQDRNFYLKVLYQYLAKSVLRGYQQSNWYSDEETCPFDYGSIMNYPGTGEWRNYGPTLESIPPGIPLGQRVAPSAGDIDTVQRMYGQPPKAVTISTNPPGVRVVVDGAAYTAPQSFTWAPGSRHRLGVITPQQSGTTRYQFARWSDDGDETHEVTASAAQTVFIANFVAQYLVKSGLASNGGGKVSIRPVSPDGYYSALSLVEFTATPNPGYTFWGWVGGFGSFPTFGFVRNPQLAMIEGPNYEYNAWFTDSLVTTITTDPPGLGVTVDGKWWRTPQTFEWTAGSQHNVSVETTQTGTSSQWVFRNWSDGGAPTHPITGPATNSTFTASFTTQYYLTYPLTVGTVAEPIAGEITAEPQSRDRYYDAGTVVRLTATGKGNFKLFGWTGDLRGSTATQTLTMNDEMAVEADFVVPRTVDVRFLLHGASYGWGPVVPGEIIAVFGLDLGPDPLTILQLSPAGRVTTSLSGVRLLFDGVPAPLLYVSPKQVGAIVPYSVAGKSTTDVAFEYNGQLGTKTTFDVEEAAPALFTYDSSGEGPGAIQNQDGKLNTASNPAAKGSIVVLYATGEGQTEPPGVDGLLASNSLPKPRLPVTARIGYVDAEVLYARAVPGQVAGLMQVSVRVPDDAPSGSAVPIQIMVGSHRSPRTVSVAVR